jgi:hypothetical protein
MHNQSGGRLLCLLHAQSIRWLLSILATHLLRMCLCCLLSSAHIAGSPTPGVCVAVHDINVMLLIFCYVILLNVVGYVVVLRVEITRGQVLVATVVAGSLMIRLRRPNKQGETSIDICTTTTDTRLTPTLLSRKQSLRMRSKGRYPFQKIRSQR